MNRYHRTFMRFFVLTACALWLYCCGQATQPQDSRPRLQAAIDSAAEVSPYAKFSIALHTPLLDSPIAFSLEPMHPGFSVGLSQESDTVYFATTSPLLPAQRYVLRPHTTLFAQNGTTLFADEDSIVFFTWDRENEPNNTQETADTLALKTAGHLESVNDTDFFALPALYQSIDILTSAVAIKIALQSTDSVAEQILSPQQKTTLSLPFTSSEETFVYITAPNQVIGGHYDITANFQ